MSTFHMFPDLPTELRLLIWEHCMQPRVVPLSWRRHINCYEDDKDGRTPSSHPKLVSKASSPVIFSIYREARFFAEMHYRKTSLCRYTQSRLGQPCNFIWLNFDIDIVEVDEQVLHDLRRYLEFPDQHLVQRLQVNSTDFNWFRPEDSSLAFENFSVLKSVDFIHESDPDWCDLTGWYRDIARPDNAHRWGCDPTIIRVIEKKSGEMLDYDRDKKLVDFDEDPHNCPETCVHIGTHDFDWATDDGSWYRRLFGDI